VSNHYNWRMNEQLDQEIKQMKASGNSQNNWMEGMSESDIKNELINHPEKNTVNQKNYGVRVRDLAKHDLEEASGIQKKIDFETKIDTTKTAGKYNNDKITYGEFSQPENIGTSATIDGRVADAHGLSRNFAVGANLSISSGTVIKPVTMPRVTSNNVFSVRSGESYETVGGNSFNMTGYQVQAYRKDGTPYTIEAQNKEEFIKKIQNIPASELQQMAPSMSIALRGYTINKGAILGDVAAKRKTLEQQLGEARAAGNVDDEVKINAQLASINYAAASMNATADEFSDDDILSSMRMNGMSANQFQDDLLIRANDSDLSWINSNTQGLDLKNRSKWSSDMRQVDEAYQSVWKAAQGSTEKVIHQKVTPIKNTVKKTQVAEKQNEPIKVDSQEAYDKLPSGSTYIDPKGVVKKKP
jgi:hypothetical protein